MVSCVMYVFITYDHIWTSHFVCVRLFSWSFYQLYFRSKTSREQALSLVEVYAVFALFARLEVFFVLFSQYYCTLYDS